MTPEEIAAAIKEQGKIMKDVQTAATKASEQHKLETGEFKEREEKMMERMEELETKLNEPPAVADPVQSEEEKQTALDLEKKDAFRKFARGGRENMSPEEMKLLTVGDSTQAGFLTSPELEREITKDLLEISMIRQWARVRTTSRKSVVINRRTSTPVGGWTPEQVAQSESNSKYGQDEIPVRTITVVSRISQEDLDDSDYNMEQEMSGDVSEFIQQFEGAAWVTGDATKSEPEGFLTNTDIPTTDSSVVGSWNADDLIDLKGSIKSIYALAPTAAFFMNRVGITFTRKLKDDEGQYLWQPSLQQGRPAMFDGSPVVEVPDMPGLVSGAKSVAFGDWNKGYVIYDRKGITVIRDPFTEATARLVKMTWHRRTTGGVRLAAALTTMTVKS